jgi:pimeloyl-ACP methyl ester carboxylesterase
MTTDTTTLVMLPGLDGTGMVFEPLLSQLPENIDARVVRYPADEPISLQEHVDIARQSLPKGRPFVLLAESFSGPIGLQLLAEPPTNLIGVVFVATFARYPSPFLLDASQYLPQGLLLKLFSTAPLCRLFCLGRAPGEALKIFQKALRSVSLGVLTRRLKILTELPPPPETNFSGPCLYLQASKDRMVSSRATGPLLKHLPQLQVVQMAGPHIILLARPEEGARRISAFVEKAMVTK